jgi:TPR repeat protein
MASSGQGLKWVLVATVIVAFAVIILGAYWLLKGGGVAPPPKGLPRMANLPPRTENTLPPPPSYPSDAPVLDQVRKALREGITPADAVVMARNLPDRPERADAAFLLLEYAAENGNAEAALAVGRFYDPSDPGASGTIRKNPTTAYEWYMKASAGGQKEAREKLSHLRGWLEARATQGSRDAQALLSNWR